MTRLLRVPERSKVIAATVLLFSNVFLILLIQAEIRVTRPTPPAWIYIKDLLTLNLAVSALLSGFFRSEMTIWALSSPDAPSEGSAEGCAVYAIEIRATDPSAITLVLTDARITDLRTRSLTDPDSDCTDVRLEINTPLTPLTLSPLPARLDVNLSTPHQYDSRAPFEFRGSLEFDWQVAFRRKVIQKTASTKFRCHLGTVEQ